jgi:hypothetical protein
VLTSDRFSRRTAGFLAAAAAVVALAGCSTAPVATSGSDAADLDAALGRMPTDMSTVHGLDVPLDRSQLTPIEELEVVKAPNTLMEHCLAEHRLAFTFPVVDPVRDAAKSRRYGLVDAGEAAAYGYRDPAIFAAHGTNTTAHQPPPDVVSVITGTEGRRGRRACRGLRGRSGPDTRNRREARPGTGELRTERPQPRDHPDPTASDRGARGVVAVHGGSGFPLRPAGRRDQRPRVRRRPGVSARDRRIRARHSA